MITRYIGRVVVQYFLLMWLLLTAILLIQQGSRYADLVFGTGIPAALLLELSLALLPNILAFTSPIALLAGVMVALGQLQGDSELIAMRAAGIGTARIALPCFLLATALTGLTLLINFKGVPESARQIRGIAARVALAKLESPLEPGVFNTDIPNRLIYARDGDNERGLWERVFIFTPEKNGQIRLVTARSGRIDAAQEQSELVLNDAVVTTFGAAAGGGEIAVERVTALRLALETGRKELLKRLQTIERTTDEMGLSELAVVAASKTGKEKIEAEVLWYRRVALAIAPLVFVLLALGLNLRFARGGRGWNIVLALVCAIFYYLLSLLGEQSARAGNFPAFAAGWLPTVLAVLLGGWWIRGGGTGGGKRRLASLSGWLITRFRRKSDSREIRSRGANTFSFRVFGLLERDVFRELFYYFALSTAALVFLYLIFTAFELWRYVAAVPNGFVILAGYLLYLTPGIIFQIAPSALLLAILATFALKARRSETVAWGAAGQNVVRVLLPAFVFAAALGWGGWELQERALSVTTQRQDALRAQLRGGGSQAVKEGRFWFSAPQRIYTFVAQTNAERDAKNSIVKDVVIYEFADDAIHLRGLKRAARAEVSAGKLTLSGGVEETIWQKSFVETRRFGDGEIVAEISDSFDPFVGSNYKLSGLSAAETEERLRAAEAVSEERRLRVALERKRSIVVLPFVVALFSSPFALRFGRRSKNASRSLAYAFGVWLVFLGTVALFEQLGNSGSLPATLAVWSPIAVLACLGSYLLARAQS